MYIKELETEVLRLRLSESEALKRSNQLQGQVALLVQLLMENGVPVLAAVSSAAGIVDGAHLYAEDGADSYPSLQIGPSGDIITVPGHEAVTSGIADAKAPPHELDCRCGRTSPRCR